MMILDHADFLDNLDPDAGLKADRELCLGKAAVVAFIAKSPDLFDSVQLDSFRGSRMLYGENGSGQLFKVGLQDGRISRILVLSHRPKSRKVVMEVGYDGTEFFGFQSQKNDRTVEDEIRKVISEINDHHTVLHGASRTDAGVHAYGQMIDFDSMRDFDHERWLKSLNGRLPKDIHIRDVYFAPPLFHARYDVFQKEYRYILNTKAYTPITRNYEWYVGELDPDILKANLSMLVGTHDFTSFSKGERDNKVRTIYQATAEFKGDTIELVFVGDGFLQHMLRLVVYQLVMLATHKSDCDVTTLIADHSRAHTTRMAPPGGLYLVRIAY